jgi:hypothetical protein
MKNLFDAATAEQVKERIQSVQPDSERLWGKMNAAQAMAHCATGLEMAVGDILPPRELAGYIFGRLVKPLALRNDEPMRRNSPTARSLVVNDDRILDAEQIRLTGLLDRFVAGGAAGCTTHPHPFFGKLTSDEWAILMYKHMDHHLRQFGA